MAKKYYTKVELLTEHGFRIVSTLVSWHLHNGLEICPWLGNLKINSGWEIPQSLLILMQGIAIFLLQRKKAQRWQMKQRQECLDHPLIALWHSLGWPDVEEEAEDFKRYFPTSFVLGYDIIFFFGCLYLFEMFQNSQDANHLKCHASGLLTWLGRAPVNKSV